MLRLYILFLHLYPPSFRLEFDLEMRSVFAEAVFEANRQGRHAVLAFLWRELVDLPRSLFWSHLHEARRKLGSPFMNKIPDPLSPSSQPIDPEPVSWKVAFLAGIPALLLPLAAILGFSLSLVPDTWQAWFGFVVFIPFFVALLGGFIWVWKLGFPRWSGGWVAWGWMAILFPPVSLLQMLGTPFGYLLQELYFRVILFVILALLLYRLIRKDTVKGTLAALVIMNLFWLPHLEFVPEVRKAAVLSVAWLIIALVSILIMKRGQVRFGVTLSLLATFVVALPFTYAANYLRVFSADTPAEVIAHRADFSDLTYYFAPTLAGCLAVLLGPFLLFELRRLSQRIGVKSRLSYRLAFTGLLINFICNLLAMWWDSLRNTSQWILQNTLITSEGIKQFIRFWIPFLSNWVTGLAYLGLALYFYGAVRVVRLSRSSPGSPSILFSTLLVLILAFLPMLAMYPAWFNLVELPLRVPFAFLHLERVRYLAYGLGLAILVAGGWLAARLNIKEPVSR
jgi:hypothetical protein